MTHVMGIARDEAVQVLIEQALCRLFSRPKRPPAIKSAEACSLQPISTRRSATLTSLFDGAIASGMSDDHW